MKIKITKTPNIHNNGGMLNSNKTNFSNGVIEINSGGLHSTNPYEGVMVGHDENFIPNLVEEGEVIYNDYVFSNRLFVPEEVKKKYRLGNKKDMTFADAAKKAQKESEERPNDPISKDGLLAIMSRLALELEAVRETTGKNTENNKFADGSFLVKDLGVYKDKGVDIYKALKPNFQKMLELKKGTPLSKTSVTKPHDYSNDDNYLTMLRYAPVVGSAIGLGLTLLSSPDYSRADALAEYSKNIGTVLPISYDILDNYLTYKPTDLTYLANRMAALAGATRRQIANQAGGNRAVAIGSLLASDYGSQLALAEAIRQGEEANLNRLILTESFNRATKLANAEMALKAAMANLEARLKAGQLGLSGYTTAMQMKDAIDALRAASLSANLTNLFDNLGNVGREEAMKRMVKENPALLYDYYGRYKGNKSAKGGKLNRKKKGGFTY